jgi:putative holliday junction resolvase
MFLTWNQFAIQILAKHLRSSILAFSQTPGEEIAKNDSPPNSQLPTTHYPSSTPQVLALGLDVGSKRIGVAGCDRTGLIATGIETIERKFFSYDVEQIGRLVKEREINVLVVGLPYSMSGNLGFQARQVQKFARKVAKALNLPIEYVDERLTSYQAEQLLIAQKISPSRNKGLIDRKAAALILQQWLDARRENTKKDENIG